MGNKITRDNCLGYVFPAMVQEWDSEKNGSLSPFMVGIRSGKKVYWNCSKGHSYQARIYSRTKAKGTGCPYCAGRKAIKGETDLQTKRPDLVVEWDFEKNGNIRPCDVTPGSHLKVWWICVEGHSYESAINNRAYGKGCPYCSRHLVIKGETDLLTCKPDVAREWDYEKNMGLKPDMISVSSNKSVWWICGNGHSYEAVISGRTRDTNPSGCPYCSGKIPIVGETDLLTKKPDVAREWDYEKNGALRPEEVTVHSNKKVWWICSKGHSYNAMINARTRNKGTGCPQCSRKRIIKGETDLLTERPDVAREWDYERNETLTPSDVFAGSAVKVFWKCSKGHSFRTAVYNRTSSMTGCPICSGRILVPGENDLETLRPEIADEWDYEENGELRPCDVRPGSNRKAHWICPNGHRYSAVIGSRTNPKHPTGCPYCAGRKAIKGETDLRTKRPDIAIEWDYKLNGELKPEDVSEHAGLKAWWICANGHSYECLVSNRTKKTRSSGCPYCAGTKLLVGENDLASCFPNLIEEWDHEKNNGKKPSDYLKGSKKMVWWKCKMNHSYKTMIYSRTRANNASGCPYCAGQKAIKGETDLLTLRPDIAIEWDYEMNESCSPEEVTVGSGKKVSWKCTQGHQYYAQICARTKLKNPTGCPYCSGNKTIKGVNDLKTLRPEVAAEWYYEGNFGLLPEDFMVSSGKRVDWKCDKGHVYRTSIAHRTDPKKPTKCPYCAGKKVVVGENDFASQRPEMLEYWDYERNKKNPNDYSLYSNKKMWWKCPECGNVWRTAIAHIAMGTGCPHCARK